MAKLLDQGPVLVLTFQAQQLTVRKEEDSDIVSARVPAMFSLTASGIPVGTCSHTLSQPHSQVGPGNEARYIC